MISIDVEGGETTFRTGRECSSKFHVFTSLSFYYNCCLVILSVFIFIALIFICKDYTKVTLLWLENQEHWLVYLIYVGLFTLVSFPFMWGYTFLAISAGYIFGIARGMTTVMIAANIGVTIAHLFMRQFYTRLPISRILSNNKVIAILSVISGSKAFKVAAFARITPIPFGLQNAIFAVSNINTKEYLIASFFGLLPAQFINVYFGSSLRSIEDVLSNKSTSATGVVVLFQIIILVAMSVYIVTKARQELNKTLAADLLTSTRIY